MLVGHSLCYPEGSASKPVLCQPSPKQKNRGWQTITFPDTIGKIHKKSDQLKTTMMDRDKSRQCVGDLGK